MWKKYGTARHATGKDMTRRMLFACWITKATDIHAEFVTLLAFARYCYANAPPYHVYILCLSCLIYKSSSYLSYERC
jgi:hypothetical protein